MVDGTVHIPGKDISDAELLTAQERGQWSLKHEHHALEAWYELSDRTLHIKSTLAAHIILPVDHLQGLQGASDQDLAAVEILGLGSGLHWESLDADLGVHSLFCGTYGSKKWMAQLQSEL
ncbi:MAG: DUF2442 domain-containing protein [Cyanobacteria bacterium J06627_3]